MHATLRHDSLAAILATTLAAVVAMPPASGAALAPQEGAASPPPAPQAADPAPAGSTTPAGELPFRTLSYEDARQLAIEQGRLCIVDATASWCVPCKQMQRDTWPAPEVGAWVSAHAIAVQLDVDKEQAIAQELKIAAMPTIVVFAGVTELDRHEGLLSAADLLRWLDDVAAGRAGRDPLIAKGLALLQSEDVEARLEIARELRRHGEPALALKHDLWLWPHTRGVPKLFGVRLSYLLDDMKRLADDDDDAAEAVARVFEEVRGKVIHTDTPDALAWVEFTAWCRAFGHEDQPLDWYDRHHAPDGTVSLDAMARMSLLQALVARKRWADAGRIGDLPALAEQHLANHRGLRVLLRKDATYSPKQVKGMLTQGGADLGRALAQLSAAAWAAGDEALGRQIAGSLLAEVDDAPSRLVLVETTLGAVGAIPEQLAWLDEATAMNGEAKLIARFRREVRSRFEEQAAAK